MKRVKTKEGHKFPSIHSCIKCRIKEDLYPRYSNRLENYSVYKNRLIDFFGVFSNSSS